MKGACVYLISHCHTSEGLDGSQLHCQCGCGLSHALCQHCLDSRVSGLQSISHVTHNLQEKYEQ